MDTRLQKRMIFYLCLHKAFQSTKINDFSLNKSILIVKTGTKFSGHRCFYEKGFFKASVKFCVNLSAFSMTNSLRK